MENSKEWIRIAKSYIENSKENITCPNCKQNFLTITLVEKENRISDIYFHCDECKRHNVMSISASYQEEIILFIKMMETR